MNEQNGEAIPEPGCLGRVCLNLITGPIFIVVLLFLYWWAKKINAGALKGDIWPLLHMLVGMSLLMIIGVGMPYALERWLWPRLYRSWKDASSPASGPEKAESSPSSSSFAAPESRHRKADEEFPWEVFAYGYLMHELLDDDAGGDDAGGEDSGWYFDDALWGEEEHLSDDYDADLGDEGDGMEFFD